MGWVTRPDFSYCLYSCGPVWTTDSAPEIKVRRAFWLSDGCFGFKSPLGGKRKPQCVCLGVGICSARARQLAASLSLCSASAPKRTKSELFVRVDSRPRPSREPEPASDSPGEESFPMEAVLDEALRSPAVPVVAALALPVLNKTLTSA